MHDCHLTQERLVDLVFDELDQKQRLILLSETENCHECRGQYRSMTEALAAVDEASDSIMPGERYWPIYREALHQRLNAASFNVPANVIPFWRRIITSSIRVPFPVAAVLALFFAASLTLALRARETVLVQSPAPPAIEKTKIVEVPVVQEKFLTRTVYLAKNRGPLRMDSRRPVSSVAPDESAQKDATARVTKESIASTHAVLSGFKPADEVKLKIIKGTYRNEK